jgi:hypothetical protein
MDSLLDRLQDIASELLDDRKVRVISKGEGYYAFEADGGTALPDVWIGASASDRQIREKLTGVFRESQRPESVPDDLAVPNLQTEGRTRPPEPGD